LTEPEPVTRILWQAAGCPAGEGDVSDNCRVCGQAAIGLPFAAWARPTFTDWDKLVPGEIICQVCQFSFAEQSELLAQKVGKDRPQRMRNYSHFVAGSEWLPLSKGDKRAMQEILLEKDWRVAVIAESGQKHVVFRAVPGVVQFEEQQIHDWRGLGDVLRLIEELYTAFSKTEIETGRYAQHRVLKFGVARWMELEKQIEPLRQSALFGLALFLAQKGDSDDDGDAREGGNAVDRDLARRVE
jgi:hypothetical protein